MASPALENPATNYNQQPIVLEPSNSQQGVTGSSYGAMASAIFMISSMMSYLNTNYSRMAQVQTEEQNTFTSQMRQATVKEGTEQAKQYWTQMGMSIGSAAFTLGGMAYGALGGSDTRAQLDQESQNLSDLKTERAQIADGAKAGQEHAGLQMAGEDAELPNPESFEQQQARIDQEAGLHGGENPEEAAKSSGSDASETLKQKDRQIEAKQATVDALNGQISNNWRKGEMGAQLGKEIVNAVGQGLQAGFVKAAAEWKAIGMAAQYNQQLSGQTASSIQKTMSDFYSYLNSVLSTLGQVAASVG